MSLSRRIFLVMLGLFCGSGMLLQLITNRLTTTGFQDVMQQIGGSMDEMQVSTVQSIEAMGAESAQDLLEEIKIAIGESLQPGEAEKFLYIAEQQEKLSSLTEFSFFGPDGMVELSSSADAEGRVAPPDVWEEARSMRTRVVVNDEEHIGLYEPLFADADMNRFHPDMALGQFYGMIYVELSKEKINETVAHERDLIAAALAQGEASFGDAFRRGLWVSGIGLLLSILRPAFSRIKKAADDAATFSTSGSDVSSRAVGLVCGVVAGRLGHHRRVGRRAADTRSLGAAAGGHRSTGLAARQRGSIRHHRQW